MEYCSYSPLLDAYHDGELDEDAAQRVRGHVPICSNCSDELDAIEAISRCIGNEPGSRLSMIEMVRLHREIDQRAEPDILRLVGVLTALAASVLIVSTVWLTEFPTRPATFISPVSVAVPAKDSFGSTVPAWEKVAMTLRVDPRPADVGDIRFVDSRSTGINGNDLAEWMIDRLSFGGP